MAPARYLTLSIKPITRNFRNRAKWYGNVPEELPANLKLIISELLAIHLYIDPLLTFPKVTFQRQ